MQSVLVPHGPEAASVAQLSWIMFGGATIIFLLVAATLLVARWGNARWRGVVSSDRFIVWSGILLPIVVLAGLLTYGLILTGTRTASASPDALHIEVTGEQWWWRVRYAPDSEEVVETANELRIPVGRDVELSLVSRDVIHSFWVPNLAGKIDMIPGKANRLRLHASQAGTYRGQCAEFCGGPHALMSFHVVAMEPDAFEAWLAKERGPAPAANATGRAVFFKSGCQGCHAVRGTEASGTIGPDLTHVAGRTSLGAAILPNDTESFRRWVRDNQHLKPGNRMPSFAFLESADLDLLAAWLGSLK
jgi:cytochrome c oxidase subunit 2